MNRIRVLPRDDGHDVRGSWMVHKNGTMVSPHTSKEAAKNKARRIASDGDELTVHRTDGTIQPGYPRTVQKGGGSESDDSDTMFSFPSGGDYGKGVLKEQDGFFD